MDQLRAILGMGSLVFILVFAFSTTEVLADETPIIGPQPHILSFKKWKEAQAVEAGNRLARAKNQLFLAQRRNAGEAQLKSLTRERDKCQQAVEITKEFSIEDYFVVYLMKLGESRFILREAAKIMSDDEVAELMKVFIESQNKSFNGPGSAWAPGLNKASYKKL